MAGNELTISEALHDPLIRLMLRADRVPLSNFEKLLKEVAEARNKGAKAVDTLTPRHCH
jgi:hypothetical protein